MIVEIRKYHALPGKLKEVEYWFQEVGIKLFAEYKIEQQGFLTEMDLCGNVLICMLRWNTLAEREARWTRLESDRYWQEGQAASADVIRQVETILLSTEMHIY